MQNSMRGEKKVVVGMSGGVDSSVAALILKRGGYDVTGVFMKNWADPRYPCPWKEDRIDAMRVAAILGIPFETWDFSKEYRESVVSYMVREYAAGRTPNPDVMCNREIKFGIFLRKALERGADYVATGHYVRKFQIPSTPKEVAPRPYGAGKFQTNSKSKMVHELWRARDANKDQSYFLWTLTQEQLKHCLFPIGDHTKPEVRKLAKKFGLPTAEKPDSQGVCFIGEINVAAFLRDQIPPRRGAVLTASGKKIGEHDGAEFYTIGQRHGIGVGGGVPFYVAKKDIESNTLVMAEGPNDGLLFSKELTVESINWISGNSPQLPLKCEARIRYRQPLQQASIRYPVSSIKEKRGLAILNTKYLIRFSEPQRAVTPGQSVVFYKDGEMLGGGVIA